MNDLMYMKRAIALAKLATAHTWPNPLVGAVVVKHNTIIGEGYHHKAGEPHAEVHALQAAGEEAKGATLYVTLEPCAHYGKTPPCADRIIAAGISRVVIGSTDPNPLVGGQGIIRLQASGIEVKTGVCEKECALLNESFFTYIQTGRPFVTLKSAMSLDGSIATFTGESQWITNETARKHGHLLRASYDAMVVGIGTILADDPLLNCRLSDSEVYDAIIGDTLDGAYSMDIRQPDVMIFDSLGRTPIEAKVFTVPNRKVHLFVSAQCSEEKRQAFIDIGADVHDIERKPNGLSINQALTVMGDMGYTSLLIEGGSALLSAFVETLAFDKIVTYIGNLIIGGTEATPAVGGNGFATLEAAAKLTFTDVHMMDNNIVIEAYRTGREGAYVYGHR